MRSPEDSRCLECCEADQGGVIFVIRDSIEFFHNEISTVTHTLRIAVGRTPSPQKPPSSEGVLEVKGMVEQQVWLRWAISRWTA